MATRAAKEKPATVPMSAKFIVKLNEGMTADEYRIMAGETGPGGTATPPDQMGQPDSIWDLKDVDL